MSQGRFVVFEGIDGSGKTTVAKEFTRGLREAGIDAVLTREPGATGLGVELRRLLLSRTSSGGAEAGIRIDAMAEALLFAADRAQHIGEVVLPCLAEGRTVVCDRYVYSSIVYQSLKGLDGPSVDEIRSLNFTATGDLRPDMVVLLDIDPRVAALRMGTRGETKDVMEASHVGQYARMRDMYLQMAKEDSSRWLVVDATPSVGAVVEAVRTGYFKRFD